jgi:hypothetical protein
MTAPGQFQISQGLTVLPPKSGNAYPIPCDEWDALKGKCEAMSNEPWFFQSAGFLLLGAAASTFTSILIGAYSATSDTVAWAVVVVTAICGGLCLYFAHKEKGVERARARDVVTQMQIIERRYQ